MLACAVLFACSLPLAQIPPPDAGTRLSRALEEKRDAALRRERDELQALAEKLEREKNAEAARATRALLAADAPAPRGASRFRPLPERIPRRETKGDDETKPIRSRAAAELRRTMHSALASQPPRLALAVECARAISEREPADAEVHRLLGYLPHDGGWITPYAQSQLKKGLERHPVYGWVEKAWLTHLDAGELPAPLVPGRPTRWLPIAEADALRREPGKGWQIRTEHFAIQANVPLAEAISFGDRLEAFHQLFTSLFADVVGPESSFALLAKNPKLAPSAAKKQHKVYYFADKAEYVDRLLPIQGEAAASSLGTYIPPRLARPRGSAASYFFRDVDGQLDVVATLYHEVSHQLLFELAGLDRYEDHRPNFWIFEGLGTYFETLQVEPDGELRYGGSIGPRMEQARKRLLEAREYVPIERFTRYDKPAFNGDAGDGDIYLHYAQAMALTVFFMQADAGAYREAFLDFARDVYKGRASKSLQARLGMSYEEIDRAILKSLETTGPE
ncbi:MAG: DUF1570 domain-containing protein [Isosphaeraceae bacterium]|nr:DUF1570 domain-containing protein [Isosphaeraceae bacterium]